MCTMLSVVFWTRRKGRASSEGTRGRECGRWFSPARLLSKRVRKSAFAGCSSRHGSKKCLLARLRALKGALCHSSLTGNAVHGRLVAPEAEEEPLADLQNSLLRYRRVYDSWPCPGMKGPLGQIVHRFCLPGNHLRSWNELAKRVSRYGAAPFSEASPRWGGGQSRRERYARKRGSTPI